jgi:HK97 family phage portal protein
MKFGGLLKIFNRAQPVQTTVLVHSEQHGNTPSIEKRSTFGSSLLQTLLQTIGFGKGSINLTPSNALQLPAIFAACTLIADTISTLPVDLLQKTNGKRTEATNHPANELLYTPNPYQTWAVFSQLMNFWLMLHGNCYAYIVRDAKFNPIALLPIHPHHCSVALGTASNGLPQLFYRIKLLNNTYDVLAADMLHIPDESTGGVLGVSRIALAAKSLGLPVNAQAYAANIYANGTLVRSIITTDDSLDDKQVKRIQADYAKYATPEGSNKVPVFDGGMKLERVILTPEESQYIQTVKEGRVDVATIYRTPPDKVGDYSKNSTGTAEQYNTDFLTYTINPLVAKWEQEMGRKLLQPSQRKTFYFNFKFQGLLRADSKTRSEIYTRYISTGILSPNEVRELEDLDPRNGGDEYYLPLNVLPASKAEAYYDAVIAGKTQAPTPPAGDTNTNNN